MTEHTFETIGTNKEAVLQVNILQSLRFLYRLASHEQTIPDENSCEICGDNGHYAFECRLNAFNIFKGSKL